MFPFGNVHDPHLLDEKSFIRELKKLRKDKKIATTFNNVLTGGSQIFNYLHLIIERNEQTPPKLYGCAAISPGIYMFGPDNFIYPCVELVGRKEYAIGDFSHELKWLPQARMWREWDVRLIKKCWSCKFVSLCGGGTCPLRGLIRNKSTMNPVCPPVKDILSTYIDSRKDVLLKIIESPPKNRT